ncbi:putative serine incorporator [Prunus yedoensis var. nudiflora]|uniref:Putative serine incorporator n=1 Tax=Prunus yedoensis var. nudiflora TaxID=2094558 RepID=A0A314Y2L2_PRUYE|nr:putative serine incorporator [Prunus yedoensis var. nudiflora]
MVKVKLHLSAFNCRMIASAEAVEAMVEVIPWEVVPESLEQKRIDYLAERKKPLRARYAYGVIFLITNLWAWLVRDYAQRVLPELKYMKSCGTGGNDCFHTLGVLRANLLVLVQGNLSNSLFKCLESHLYILHLLELVASLDKAIFSALF